MATDRTAPASTPGTPKTPLLPRKFGRYALFDFIGKGGMAEIYLARAKTEIGATKLCVVKQILPELAVFPQFAEMLIHEAKLAARLSHANVVQVFDLGRADDRLFIAMDYVEGFDLNDLLRRCSRTKTPLPFEFGLRIIIDTLKGLDYAHRRVDDAGKPLGIVHRDVSPSNVLISFEGEIKICDFGIAHANDIVAAEGVAIDDAIKGKAGYMSPEHARGEKIDARADVFAAGILLWELVAGRRMYKADTGKPPLLEQARAAEIPELPARDVPHEEQLRAIVHKALARDPAERYASAQGMLRALEDYLGDAKLLASPLRLGEWLVEKFGADIVQQRRARERATDALERGAPVSLVPLPPAPTPLPSMIPPAPDTEPASVPPPRISSTPPPTPLPGFVQALVQKVPTPAPIAVKRAETPLPALAKRARHAAAIDRPPPSMGPSSFAAVDVSPPSSQLPVLPHARPPSNKSYLVLAAAVFAVAVAILVVLILLRAR